MATGPNTSDEYWTFGGVSLHTHAWSVMTLGGRLGVPPLRGDDQTAAYVPGELWMPKVPGPRTLNLPMWMTGVDPATGAAVPDPRTRFNDNWAYLMQTFWNPDAEQVLTRRWFRTDPTGGQISLVSADAMAQLVAGDDLRAKMTNRTRAEFEVPLKLAHPFFYGPTITTTFDRPAGASPANTWSRTVTVTNPGDWTAFAKFCYVDFVGPLFAPTLTNTSRNVSCGISRVDGGETVTLDVREFIALSSRTSANGKTNRSGEIYNSGTRSWMALARGANTLTLTASGAGRAVLRFRPPYV